MKLIIYPDVDLWNFVMADLYPRSDVRLFPLNRYCNFAQKVVRKVTPFTTLPAWTVLNKRLRKALRGLKPGDSVILCEYTDPVLVSVISRTVPVGVSKYCWLWGQKGADNDSFNNSLRYLQHHQFCCMTYNESDAAIYPLRLWHQFFCIHRYHHILDQSKPILWDFFFIGYAKDREPEIQAMQNLLSAYSSHFTIVRSITDYVPYAKYMEQASQSRCIVEVLRSGDTSCTLRPLEALSLRKKLISNNPNLRNYSFYHPQNIFIFGVDDVARLPEFINSPFLELSTDVVEEYDIARWIDNFSNPLS